jgi:hypothetical protein
VNQNKLHFTFLCPDYQAVKIVVPYCAISYSNLLLERGQQYTDKKENKIFLTYEEIQMGSGAKSYMRKGFLNPNTVYEAMHKYFHHI